MVLNALLFVALSNPSVLLVEVVDPKGTPLPDAVVEATPEAGGTSLDVIRVKAAAGKASLKLEPGAWQIRASHPKRWGWPTEIVTKISDEPRQIALTLWPLGRIQGTLSVAAGDSLPTEVRVFPRRDKTPAAWPRSLTGYPIVCPMTNRRWFCGVPANVSLDLQLDARQFAPRYFWDVQVGAGETLELGQVSLFRGASVSGWVVDSGTRPRSGARVELVGPDGGRLEGGVLMTLTNPRGFFQIGPVPKGRFHVIASAEAESSNIDGVELDDREQRLRSPLVLNPPAELQVSLDPPRDPRGHPWLINLFARSGQHGHAVVRAQPISGEGVWAKAGLSPGEYKLTIASSEGGTWYEKGFRLESGVTQERVTIQTLRVVGTVSLGGEPLVGKVVLFDRTGRVRVPFATNDSGEFSGDFPGIDVEKARWGITVEAPSRVKLALESIEPESSTQAEVKFNVDLPPGLIEGTVVNEAGVPQSAVVVVLPPDLETSLSLADTLSAASTGRFRIAGLNPGEYRVYARGRVPDGVPPDAIVSEIVPVQVHADKASASSKVTLILRDAIKLSGRIVTPSGEGIAGASVEVLPSQSSDIPIRVNRSDAEGRFSARVPRGTRHVAINVTAVGVGRLTLGRTIAEDHALNIIFDLRVGQLIFGTGEAAPGPSSVMVSRDGGFVSLAELQAWSARNGGALEESGLLRIPLMAPGRYSACRILGPQEFSAFLSDALPRDRCDQGDLPPGGELRLDVDRNAASNAR